MRPSVLTSPSASPACGLLAISPVFLKGAARIRFIFARCMKPTMTRTTATASRKKPRYCMSCLQKRGG